MNQNELIPKLDELIEFESRRIRKTPIPADHRTDEYRDNIGKLMRYMGKRDAFVYVKHLIETQDAEIEAMRERIEREHAKCIEPFIGGLGGFGETFCGHIHELGLTFRELADHFEISMEELAMVTADHIRRLKTTQSEEWGNVDKKGNDDEI